MAARGLLRAAGAVLRAPARAYAKKPGEARTSTGPGPRSSVPVCVPCVSPQVSLRPSVPRGRASRLGYLPCPRSGPVFRSRPRPRALPGGDAASPPFLLSPTPTRPGP